MFVGHLIPEPDFYMFLCVTQFCLTQFLFHTIFSPHSSSLAVFFLARISPLPFLYHTFLFIFPALILFSLQPSHTLLQLIKFSQTHHALTLPHTLIPYHSSLHFFFSSCSFSHLLLTPPACPSIISTFLMKVSVTGHLIFSHACLHHALPFIIPLLWTSFYLRTQTHDHI